MVKVKKIKYLINQIDNQPKYNFIFPAVFIFCKMNVFF